MDATDLLPHQVRGGLFVFQTDVIQQLRIEHDGLPELDSPRLGVRLGIVRGELGVEADRVGPFGLAGVVNDVFNRQNNKYISVYSRPLVSNIAANYCCPSGAGTRY